MGAAAMMAAAAMAMPAAGGGPAVDIPGRYFTPPKLQVLVGETVTWRNSDHTTHTVSGDGLRSESLSNGDTFSFTFEKPGEYDYVCSIHRSMRGTVRVAALGLTGPEQVLSPGDTATLGVLAPAGTRSVTLERLTASGAEPAGEAAPGPDGRASFRLAVSEPGRYRARAGDLTSAVVPVHVAPRVRATALREGDRIRIRAAITPAQPGATVALKRYVRERFDYVPIRTVRTVDGRRATFTIRSSQRLALRVGVTRPSGGWSPSDSALVVVPSRR